MQGNTFVLMILASSPGPLGGRAWGLIQHAILIFQSTYNMQHLLIQSVKPTERVRLRIKTGYLFNINHQICSNASEVQWLSGIIDCIALPTPV